VRKTGRRGRDGAEEVWEGAEWWMDNMGVNEAIWGPGRLLHGRWG